MKQSRAVSPCISVATTVGSVASPQINRMRADGPDIARGATPPPLVLQARRQSYRVHARHLHHPAPPVLASVGVASASSASISMFLEAGQRQFETRFGKFRQFERQHLLIPASVQRQPVVGDDQARFCAVVRWASSITGT